MAMASGLFPTKYGGRSSEAELRIVLLGNSEEGRMNVAKVILGENVSFEEGVCVKKESKEHERKLVLVNRPEQGEMSQQDITKSVILCHPGPHVLLLVLPVANAFETHTEQDIKAAQQYMEALSERVWKYTMVLFVSEDELDVSTIEQNNESARNLLKKCGGKHFVLQSTKEESCPMRSKLLERIDTMVERNHGDFYIPQVYYDLIQSITPQSVTDIVTKYEDREEKSKQMHNEELSKLNAELNDYKKNAEEGGRMKKRCGSEEFSRPIMDEGNKDKTEGRKSDSPYWDLVKPGIVILMAVIGALIGSVAGSQYGMLGACSVMVVGCIIFCAVAKYVIQAAEATKSSGEKPQSEGARGKSGGK